MTLKKPLSDLYWRLRWAVWDFQEHLLVRLLSQRMSSTPLLYVHPRCGGPPRAVVKLLDKDSREIEAEPYEHSHIEGKRKYEKPQPAPLGTHSTEKLKDGNGYN